MKIIKIFKRGWWPDHNWFPFKGKDKCRTIRKIEHPTRAIAVQMAKEVCAEMDMKRTKHEREADVRYEWTFLQEGE